MELQGRIIVDLPMQEGVSKAGNAWKKKEWVLETTNTQFPKKVKFTVFGEDRINNMNFQLNKDYIIQIDIESREWNDRWYTDVMAYSSRPVDQGQAPTGNWEQQGAPVSSGPQFGQPVDSQSFTQMGGNQSQGFMDNNGSSDDLPF